VETGGRTRILVIADRPAVRQMVARLLAEAGLHIRITSTVADAISVVVLERPAVVVFDSHLAVTEGTHAVSVLLRLAETYGLPAVDFADQVAADDGGLEGAARPAPLRPKPQLPYLRAHVEVPNESVG
jgi:CheY-like chemotaxis protein